jgi:hypothetical protein
MVVANQGDVQFALKTYNQDPAVISVPAVRFNILILVYESQLPVVSFRFYFFYFRTCRTFQ